MALKISLICTVYNEEKTIATLLESIENQTRVPDEIIIVDAGSKDNTVPIIRNFTNKLPIKLIISSGVNVSTGRNIAIRNTLYDIIASTDGGCEIDKYWLQNIIKPFEDKNVDIVSGVYTPLVESEFQEIVSYMIFPEIEKLDSRNFNPSSRSIAFKKKAWESVGGYPEYLMTAEDTLFDLNLRKAGFRFSLAKDAIVSWRIRENRKDLFKMFFRYAIGEGVEFLFVKSYFIRYLTFLTSLFTICLFWPNPYFWLLALPVLFFGIYVKHLRKVKKFTIKRFFISLSVAITIECAVFLGYVTGNLRRIFKLNSSKI
jgi:glycosyltransferase involved in cell wall biosynthesis